MIYIASPYSGTPYEQDFRYREVRSLVAMLLREQCMVFSPIVYCHDLALVHDLPKDAAYWTWMNEQWMSLCSSCMVIMLPGWKESKGVQAEIAWFEKHGRAIGYVEVAS